MDAYVFPTGIECEGERRTVRLSFLFDELMYDISNCAYVEGELMDEDAGQHARHQTQDVAEDGNKDRVLRALDLALSVCTEALYPYTKTEPEEDEEDVYDLQTERETYTIALSVPAGFSRTTVDLLSKQIHEFLVCMALADWIGITSPQASVKWKERADGLLEKLKNALVSRIRPVRRRMSPF